MDRNDGEEARRKRCINFKNVDFFGKPIRLSFRQKETFQTTYGGIVSTICATLMLVFLIARSYKLVSKEDPFFSTTIIASPKDFLFDLWELGFIFALSKVDPTVGRVEALITSVTPQDGKVTTPITLIDCKKLLAGETGFEKNTALKFTFDELLADLDLSDYLCPVGIEALPLRGEFGEAYFNYVSFKVFGCDLGPEKCMSDDDIPTKTFDVVKMSSLPNILLENDSKSYVEYTRDTRTFFHFDSAYK